MFNLKQFFMQKKNLLGGALLLLCTLFVFTGCKEVMSSLDNPVSAYLKVDPASAKIYRGQSYKIPYSTISNAKPIFTTADDKVATVDENGVVTGVMMGTTKITIEVPATDYYQAASAEFTVEVDGLLKMPLLEKEMALNEEYNLGVTSVSTGAITYKSSNTKVATVDADGNVKAIACGDATITVHIEATPEYDRTEDLDFKAKVRILNYNQLKSLIDDNTEVTAIFGDNADITTTGNLIWSGKKISISGNPKKPATMTLSNGFIINDNFTIENVNIDASSINAALIRLDYQGCDKKNQSEFSDAAKTNVNLVDIVTINNVMIKNLKSNIIYSNGVNWAIRDFTITNSIIQLDNGSYTFIRMDKPDGGNCSIKNINITGNTIYNLQTSSSAYFIRFCNANNAGDVWGQRNSTSKLDWNISNNTLIRMFTAKDFGNNIVNVAGVTNTVKDNIFYDVYRLYQYLPKNQVKITTGNYIYWDVTAKQTNDISGSGNYKDKDGNPYAIELTEKPFTYPTEAIDLTKKNGGLNLKPSGDAANAGDPRWYEAN